MRLTDLRPGMIIYADRGFTCVREGHKVVQQDREGSLYITCTSGRHYLDGQENAQGELVGIRMAFS